MTRNNHPAMLFKSPDPKIPHEPQGPASGPKPLKEERAEIIKKPGTGKGK